MKISKISFTIGFWAVLSCDLAMAASLNYPLLMEYWNNKNENKVLVTKLLSSLNEKLEDKNFEIFPDSIELKNAKQALKVLDEIENKFTQAIKALEIKSYPDFVRYSLSTVGSKAYRNTEKNPVRFCYKGEPHEAVDLIASLTDIAFSDQLMPIGYRYKSTEKVFFEGDEDHDWQPEIWKEWRGKGEAILYVWAESDGGEDINTVIIPRCK